MHREQFYKEASVYKRVKQNRIALLRGLLLSYVARKFHRTFAFRFGTGIGIGSLRNLASKTFLKYSL